MYHYVKKHKTFFLSIIFLILFGATVSYANPPSSPYAPGTTLDPACAPASTNCTVSFSNTYIPYQGAVADLNIGSQHYINTDGTIDLSSIHTTTSPSTLSTNPRFLLAYTLDPTNTVASHGFADDSVLYPTVPSLSYNSYDAFVTYGGSQDIDHYLAFQSRSSFIGTGTLNLLQGFRDEASTSGHVHNRYGVRISPLTISGSGSVDNNYGVYVESLSTGTSSTYAVFTAGSTPSRFGGTVSVGSISFLNTPSTDSATSPTLLTYAADGSIGKFSKYITSDANFGVASTTYTGDLNSVAASSVAWLSGTATNLPSGVTPGGLWTSYNSASSASQIELDRGGTTLSFRSKNSGTWSSWKNLILANNLTTAGNFPVTLTATATTTITLPTSGTLATTVSSIQNQTATPQVAGFNINGTGMVATLGIAQTSPLYLLDVGSTGTASGIIARFQTSAANCTLDPTTTGGLTCSSDMNLKKNIANLADNSSWSFNTNITMPNQSVLAKVLALNPVAYNWNTENENTIKHDGFIAQEVRQVFPDLVSQDPTTNLLSLNYTGLIPYTVEAIKEMNVVLQAVPAFTDQTMAQKVSDFLRGIAERGEAVISKVTTKQLCLQDTCIDQDELKNLIQLQQIMQNNTAQQTTTVTTDQGDSQPQSPEVTEPVVTTPVHDQSPEVSNLPIDSSDGESGL